MKKALQLHKQKLEHSPGPEEYVFSSRQGGNRPITRQMAFLILKEIGEVFGIEDNISTHTLRKTFAYHTWKRGTPLETLMEILNHSSTRVTRNYIGITQDMINDVYIDLNL